MLNLVLLGPPGVGKGTQAVFIAQHFGIPHISTGDMFRSAMQNKTKMGLEAKLLIDQGKLVPDPVVLGLVNERLQDSDCQKGFIFDGFPRTLPQATQFQEILKNRGQPLTRVVCLEVPENTILKRLAGRRVCPNCAASYHVDRLNGQTTCPQDGALLVQRPDDQEEAIEVRLKAYDAQTAPLKDFYNKAGILLRIDGVGEPADVFAKIKEAIGKITG